MTDRRRSSRTIVVKLIFPLFPLLCAPLGLLACKEDPPKLTATTPPEPTAYSATPASASASASTPPPSTVSEVYPLSEQQIAKIVNPKNEPEYTGPTGGVEGVIHVTGDKPLMRTLQGVPKECAKAQDVYGPTYRAGAKGELADTLVGVIEYEGFVRPSRADKVVTIHDCVLDPRVIDLSLGQRLMVGSDDETNYMPQTAAKSYVGRLTIKGMSPVPVFFTVPAAYAMSWILGDPPATGYPTATVFVIPNALHTVTGLDGKFRITGIPVGKAKLTASHLDMKEASQDIDVKAGEVTKVDLTLTYKATAAPSVSVKPNPIK